jgi:hypothetical protein
MYCDLPLNVLMLPYNQRMNYNAKMSPLLSRPAKPHNEIWKYALSENAYSFVETTGLFLETLPRKCEESNYKRLPLMFEILDLQSTMKRIALAEEMHRCRGRNNVTGGSNDWQVPFDPS